MSTHTPYAYLTQPIQSTCLIEAKDNDSFYNPATLGHTGYAWDGTLYNAGVQQPGPVYASWYSESPNYYRGGSFSFPQAGLVLLSRVALAILDESATALTLWMQFLLQSNATNPSGNPPVLAGSFALTNNFNGELNGWLPSKVIYADGVVSVIYTPDYGNQTGQAADGGYNINSSLILNIDFCQDKVYLDVAVPNALATVPVPLFSIPEGYYTSTQRVTISDTLNNATIYYTVDGTTPTVQSSLVYSTPISINSTTTLTAVATAPNYLNSLVTSATYTINTTPPAPLFSIPGGTFNSPQTITISDTLANVVIYYTTDGTTPTTSSSVYTSPLTIGSTLTSTSTTLQATAFISDASSSSSTTSATFIVEMEGAGSYLVVPSVAAVANIYWEDQWGGGDQSFENGWINVEFDGRGDATITYMGATGIPTFNDDFGYNNVHLVGEIIGIAGPVAIPDPPSVGQYIAIQEFSPEGTFITGPANINLDNAIHALVKWAPGSPVFNIPAGSYNTPLLIAVSSLTPGTTIYYTVDGTAPTTASTKYTTPVAISSTTTVKAIGVNSGIGTGISNITTAVYTIL